MRRTRVVRAPTVLAVVAMAALLAGCDGPRPAPARSSGTHPPAGPARPSPSPTWDLTNPPVVVASPALEDFGERPNRGGDGVFAVGAGYVIRPDPASPGGRTMVVTRRSDNAVVLRHTPAADFETNMAAFSGDILVLGDEDTVKGEPAKEPARATIYDLRRGTATPTSRVPGAPPLSLYALQGSISDGRYYYSASVNAGFSNCIGEIDLTALRGRTVECGQPGEWLLYVTTARHGASWVHFHGAGYDVCRDGRQIQHGVLGPVGPTDDCGTFDVAAYDTWQIWGSFPPGPVQPSTTLKATDGTRTVNLGEERQMSMRVCGEHVYWSDLEHKTVLRWRPGVGAIERIYQVTTDAENTWAHIQRCSDNILTIAVQHYDRTGQATMRILALPA